MTARAVMTITAVVGLLAIAPVGTADAQDTTCRGHRATLVGTDGNDVLVGTAGRDVIVAGAGDDVVRGRAGNDLICGGAGDDDIRSGPGHDVVDAGPGDDQVRGGPGHDKATGGSGDDVLGGGNGTDRLRGGSGDDTAMGHRGWDTCRAERVSGCEWDDAEVTVARNLAYGAADGNVLRLDLYRPTPRATTGRAAVIYAHGGGFTSGSKEGSRAVSYATDFARADLVAASINYRLNGVGAVADAQHDMQAAVRWLRTNANRYGVDPDRIFVMGYSAGALAALFTNFNSEDPGTSGTPGVPSNVAGAVSLAGLVDPSLIDPGEPPILLYHGADDGLVPLGGARVTCNVTLAAGNECELVVFENTGHGLDAFHDQVVAGVLEFVQP